MIVYVVQKYVSYEGARLIEVLASRDSANEFGKSFNLKNHREVTEKDKEGWGWGLEDKEEIVQYGNGTIITVTEREVK